MSRSLDRLVTNSTSQPTPYSQVAKATTLARGPARVWFLSCSNFEIFTSCPMSEILFFHCRNFYWDLKVLPTIRVQSSGIGPSDMGFQASSNSEMLARTSWECCSFWIVSRRWHLRDGLTTSKMAGENWFTPTPSAQAGNWILEVLHKFLASSCREFGSWLNDALWIMYSYEHNQLQPAVAP